MRIRLISDKTGFPLLVNEIWHFAIHLWPVTKAQFEIFMSETGKYGDLWYEEVLRLNPRTSIRDISQENYEGLFLSGILPEEARDFAAWMGDDYDLPETKEWRKFYKLLKNIPLHLSIDCSLSLQADYIWKGIRSFSEDFFDFSLIGKGLVEWVRAKNTMIGLGSPRGSFHSNAWNPLEDEILPIDLTQRLSYFGFRLIRGL